jgi:halogenation protein CepH
VSTEVIDVLVIGGGPSGACYSAIVARAGWRVRVLEGKNFPRHHIGESLLAASMPLLRDLGVLPALEGEGFLPKTGSMFVWNDREIGLAMPAPARAFQVPRARFDQILLEHAARSGAGVQEGQWVRSIERLPDGNGYSVHSEGDLGRQSHRARLVVDASGLFQFAAKRENLDIHLMGPQRLALSAYYRGAGRLTGFHQTNVISEATRDGWLWFIPLTEQLTSVGFVGDVLDYDGRSERHLSIQIAASLMVRELLGGADMERRPRLLRYTNHLVSPPLWWEDRIIIGDSAFFVDPLFSTGVHGALYSATLAASATNSVLAGDVKPHAAAAWYDREVRSHHGRIQHTIDLLYGIHPGTSRFWRSRDLSGMSARTADEFAFNLGALGVELFQHTFSASLLPIPVALQKVLDEFAGAPRPNADPPEGTLALASEVEVRRDFARRADGIVPCILIAHSRNRRFPVRVPFDHPAAVVMPDLLAGRPTIAASERTAQVRQLLSLLATADLVVPAAPAALGT